MSVALSCGPPIRDQGRGDGPKAGTSRASEAARAKPGAPDGRTVSLTLLTEKNWPSEIEETGPGCPKAAREQTLVAQTSPPLYFFVLFVFGRIFQINFFQFFDRSGPVRELLPSYRSPRPCKRPHWVLLQAVRLAA